jgi:pyruvate dehydrogenase E1 component
VVLRFALDFMQRDGSLRVENDVLGDARGGSVYLRLSTRSIPQPQREMGPELEREIIDGGYWLRPPGPGARLAIVYCGAVAPEALAAHAALREDLPQTGVLAVTSPDRLARGWHHAGRTYQRGQGRVRSHVEQLLDALPADAALVTVHDGYPTALSWLGSVRGHRVHPLGVDDFGQSGTIADLYRHYRIDADAILDACATAVVPNA